MVKPILIIAGSIPIIFAILLITPLTNPEIPITAIDPNDIVEIEFTKHHLTTVSFGITERLGSQQTEILVIKNNGEIQYTLVNDGSPITEKNSKIDSDKQTKLIAMIKETGFMAIPFDSFVIKDETDDFVKYGVKITYNEKMNQLFWPEQDATDELIPPIITEVEIELESILNSIRE
mgnify:CR=1 FL=1|tara:strand:+ start:112 stop:642 length:531 start_codon:yes stop_codon:yes gene_type:complete